MTRIAADSVNPAAIPAGVDVAFFYANGSLGVQTQAEAQAAHPGKVVLSIDVTGAAPSAAVRDWENGDKSGSLEQWVIDHNQLSGKKDAVIYCNRSTIASVRQLTGSQVLGADYFLFVSTLDGTMYGPSDLPGVVACQVVTVGGYDLDVIWDDTWHPSASTVKADIMEGLAALNKTFSQVVTNVGRLPG